MADAMANNLSPLMSSVYEALLPKEASSVLPVSPDDVFGLLLILAGSLIYLTRGTYWDKPDPLHRLWFEKPQNTAGFVGERKTRNIAKKLEELNKDIVVFWGSQSGTAERLAGQLSRQLRYRFALEVLVADLSDYDAPSIAELPSSKKAVFIISTYGEGDPPDNANDLWSWIRSDRKPPLPDLRYAAFGLGNSNYKEYNRVVDCLTKCFDELGARSFLGVGKADDAKGKTIEDFENWQDELFGFLKNSLNYLEQDLRYQPALSCSYEHTINTANIRDGTLMQPRQTKERDTATIYKVLIEVARELFTDSDRSCLSLDIDLSQHPALKYKTGDHLALWPENPSEEVERLLNILGVQEQRSHLLKISVLDHETELKIPNPTTLDALFRCHLEICGPVSRDLITQLVQFAPSAESKMLLKQLAGERVLCTEYLGRKYMNIGRLLEDASGGAPWILLPLSFILENLPLLKPRSYSISSSSVVDPQRVSITALVSNTVLHSDPTNCIPGLTSNYLALRKVQLATDEPSCQSPSILPPHYLKIQISRSKFKLPLTSTTPIIMIASGTGIAPFRAFLQERIRLQSMGREIGKSVLFYGFRNQGEYLYESEIQNARALLGPSFTIVTARSREGEPCYVQDRVRERFGEVKDMLLQQNAVLYVCGSANMGHGVTKMLGEGFSSQGWGEERFREWIEQMKGRRKWQEEVWG